MDRPTIVLIGAGSAQFGYDTIGDIFQSEEMRRRKAHLVLHDINPETMAVVEKTGNDFIAEHNLPFTISATTDRKEALKGADFCIISIEVGDRFELWEQDWRIPQQYGVRQVYGENGGPGGFFHSLRIIPPILEICGDIMEICPDAFVFNYSNPMSRICTTVHMKYPGIKFIGLCHEIASLHEHLPKMLNMPWDQMDVTASGLNHFSVLLEAKEKGTGRDLYPQIREEAQSYFQKVPSWLPEMLQEAGKKSERTIRPWHERGLFKTILDNYGLLPITTDSHFGEYPAWAYSVVDHKGILDFYNTYKTYVSLSTPRIDLECHERVVPIMDGILTDAGFVEGAVNIPNDGLIDEFPSFVAVEVPAKIDSKGVTGIPTGHLMPPGLMGLFYNQVAIHRLTAETVLTGSKEMALQALLSDPMVTEVDKTIEMLDQMLEIQQKYLGYIK